MEKLGYPKDEITLIVNALSREQLEQLLATDYNAEVATFLRQPDARKEKITDYLYAHAKYGLPVPETVVLVNHPSYQPEEDWDLEKLMILLEPYYIPENKARYFHYLAAAKKAAAATVDKSTVPILTAHDVVALVNTNHDQPFYTTAQPAKVSQREQVLVNQYYYLTPDYRPNLLPLDHHYGDPELQIEAEAYQHFRDMFQAASDTGLILYVTSGYRSYEEQVAAFAHYATEKEAKQAHAAKPGFSEHQTGYALDIFAPGATKATFRFTPEARWLAMFAYRFGFILRYPEGKEDLTGFPYEAWHYRYVGVDLAKKVQESGLTYEEYWAFYIDRSNASQ